MPLPFGRGVLFLPWVIQSPPNLPLLGGGNITPQAPRLRSAFLRPFGQRTLIPGRRKVTPYALALKDESGKLVETEKMVSIQSSVPDSSSEPTTIGDVHSVKATTSHDTNPSFQGANVQQDIETNKKNNIKTENIRMNKNKLESIKVI